MRMTSFLSSLFGAAVLCSSISAWAIHADIEPIIDNGTIFISNGETDYATGLKLFENDEGFQPSFLGLSADDPGFDVLDGVLNPGDKVGVKGYGSLLFWDGDSWDPATNQTVTIFGTGPAQQIVISGTGVSGSPFGSLATADAGGGIHQHIPFVLGTTDGTDPEAGAYLFGMSLFSLDQVGGAPKYGPSNPFLIALPYNIDVDTFEAGVNARLVPEPETYALMGVGLLFVGVVARKRRKS